MTQKFPKDKQAYWQTGLYYHFNNSYPEAIKEFKKALELDPTWDRALNLLGYSYAYAGYNEKAIETLNKLTLVAPGDANPYDSFGDVYYYMGEFDKAIEKYSKAVELDTDFIRTSLKVVHMYAQKEEYSEAIRWIEYLCSHSSIPGHQVSGGIWKVLLYCWLGQMDKALSEIQLAADKAGPEMEWLKGHVYLNLGWIYSEKGNYVEGMKYFKQAFNILLNTPPSTVPSYSLEFHEVMSRFFYGWIDLQKGIVDSAEHRLQQMKRLIPSMKHADYDWSHYYYNVLRGKILLKRNSLNKALSIFKELTMPRTISEDRLYPIYNNIPITGDLLAQTYIQRNEMDNAIIEYEKLVTRDGIRKDKRLIHPRYYYELAKLYEEKGWPGKAIEQYEKFLVIWKDADEDLPELIDARARLAKLREED